MTGLHRGLRSLRLFSLGGILSFGALAPTVSAAQEVEQQAAVPTIQVQSAEAAADRRSATREDIARSIESATTQRNLGIVSIAFGAAAAVAGWVSFAKEVDEEDDRDRYNYYNPNYRDSDEEENFDTFYAGLAVGVALIAVGTVSVVDGVRELRQLNRQRVRLGYNGEAGAMMVGLNYEF